MNILILKPFSKSQTDLRDFLHSSINRLFHNGGSHLRGFSGCDGASRAYYSVESAHPAKHHNESLVIDRFFFTHLRVRYKLYFSRAGMLAVHQLSHALRWTEAWGNVRIPCWHFWGLFVLFHIEWRSGLWWCMQSARQGIRCSLAIPSYPTTKCLIGPANGKTGICFIVIYLGHIKAANHHQYQISLTIIATSTKL